MRIYSPGDEERIRTGGLVREWASSHLIEPAQLAAMEEELRTDLRRTNTALRVVLFIFSAIVLQAALGLGGLMLSGSGRQTIGMAALVAAAAAIALGESLITRLRFYRFGVEEACVVWAVGLAAAGVALLLSTDSGGFPATATLITAVMAAGAAAARYGYRYLALGAMAGAAVVPVTLDVTATAMRLLAAGVLLAVFVAAGAWRRATGEESLQDELGLVEAVAWLGLYAALNLMLTSSFSPTSLYPRAFVIGTHAAIWVLPVAGLTLGIRGRHRLMIWANLAAALATLATNKMYFGWERHTWDPILLGLALTGVAVGVRRWLSAGRGGTRAGFTPHRILASDARALAMVGTVAGAVQPAGAPHGHPPAPGGYEPGGGASGGGGATGRF